MATKSTTFLKSHGLTGRQAWLLIDLINIPGHAGKSWEEQITFGIAADKQLQKRSLVWSREQSRDPNRVESLANHDPDIAPRTSCPGWRRGS